MSASDTAQRVIEWAATGGKSTRLPPQGDLLAVEQLARPSEALCAVLGMLTANTAGRLHFGSPPLDDGRPVTTGGILLAAAIGVAGSGPEIARLLLRSAPSPGAPWDWVARHGVVEPALPHLPATVADDCRLQSPLTAAYDRPVSGQEAVATAVVRQLLERHRERTAFTAHLAQPTPDLEVRAWRTELLDRLRLGEERERRFVLDVYEAMMVNHRLATQAQVRAAYGVLTNPAAASQEPLLQDALSVARWWGPLWAIERSDIDLLRSRYYLGYEYRDGIKLYRLAQRLTGKIL